VSQIDFAGIEPGVNAPARIETRLQAQFRRQGNAAEGIGKTSRRAAYAEFRETRGVLVDAGAEGPPRMPTHVAVRKSVTADFVPHSGEPRRLSAIQEGQIVALLSQQLAVEVKGAANAVVLEDRRTNGCGARRRVVETE